MSMQKCFILSAVEIFYIKGRPEFTAEGSKSVSKKRRGRYTRAETAPPVIPGQFPRDYSVKGLARL